MCRGSLRSRSSSWKGRGWVGVLSKIRINWFISSVLIEWFSRLLIIYSSIKKWSSILNNSGLLLTILSKFKIWSINTLHSKILILILVDRKIRNRSRSRQLVRWYKHVWINNNIDQYIINEKDFRIISKRVGKQHLVENQYSVESIHYCQQIIGTQIVEFRKKRQKR